jgi:hypothetical protein
MVFSRPLLFSGNVEAKRLLGAILNGKIWLSGHLSALFMDFNKLSLLASDRSQQGKGSHPVLMIA